MDERLMLLFSPLEGSSVQAASQQEEPLVGDDEHVIVADQHGRAEEGNSLPQCPQVGRVLQLVKGKLAKFDI